MVKLIDVAEKAGVSQATASMALSGKGRISRDVRARILEAAEELGYRNNRPLKTPQWILLVNTDPAYDSLAHFFNPVIRKLQYESEKKGFLLEILPIGKSSDREGLFRKIKDINPVCLLSIHFADNVLFTRLEEENIPCVIINNSTYIKDFHTVCVDDFNGACEGTEHLIKKGHRNIGFIDYDRPLKSVQIDRYYGFLKAMETHGLAFKEENRFTVNLNEISSLEGAVDSLLRRRPAITALFIHDDLLGMKIGHILRNRGVNIPQEMSLICPGDTIDYNQMENPPLSTMRIDTELMGQYAVNMMEERLQNSKSPVHALKIKQIYKDRGTIGAPGLPPE